MTQHPFGPIEEESKLVFELKSPKALEKYEKVVLGQTLKKLRKKLKLTQRELASKLKTSQSVIARMETGKQNFTIGTLIKITSLLGKKVNIRFT